MPGRRSLLGLAVVIVLVAAGRQVEAATPQVVSTSPARNAFAAATSAISITFDQALLTSSIDGGEPARVRTRDRPGERSGRVLERQQDGDLDADARRSRPARSWW